jgi:MazG family protein
VITLVDTDNLLLAIGIDPAQGYQVVLANYLTQHHYPQVEVNLPLLISDVVPATDVARLAHVLGQAYPADHPLTLIAMDEGGKLERWALRLDQLASQAAAKERAFLYAPPLAAFGSVSALLEIVAHLRSPDGCPWDRAQTLLSMRHDLLSECAEVIEAIDAEINGEDHTQQIAEELGDLIMAAALMVQIAVDEGRFQMADAMRSIVTKLRRRHPHVFEDVVVDGVQTVLTNWDAIKAQEKAERGVAHTDPLDGVPAALPALEKARQLQSKAAKSGLLDRAALAASDPTLAAFLENQLDEAKLGEFLWCLVAVAHEAGLNAEDALRSYAVGFRQSINM